MSTLTIYHNPRCSKSRQTLARIEDAGVTPTVVEYLKNPPSAGELAALVDALGVDVPAVVRFKESLAKELGLSDQSDHSRDAWLAILAEHPKLLERPIVVKQQHGEPDQAVIGRPPENVDALLDSA